MPEAAFVRAGAVVTGRDDVLSEGAVAIDADGRIARVGADLMPERGCPVYDFPGAVLVPGFVDCHVHLTLDGRPDWMDIATQSPAALTVRAVAAAQRTLAGGVTTARCLGAPHGVEIAVRDAIAAGMLVGPRLVCSGRAICSTGGHGTWMGRSADGPAQLRAAVRQELAEGADLIKVIASGGVLTPGSRIAGPAFTHEELAACVDEAHRQGVVVVAHALTEVSVRQAVEVGCDGVEHGDGLDVETAVLMARRGVHLGATLTSASDFLASIDNQDLPKDAVDKLVATWPRRVEAFRTALANGVPIVMSTDAGTPFHEHGRNVAEIAAMVDEGLDVLFALRAATLGGAEALGLEGQIGTLEVGKQADLVVVNGNLVQDPSVLRSPDCIAFVMKAGTPYGRLKAANGDRAVPT